MPMQKEMSEKINAAMGTEKTRYNRFLLLVAGLGGLLCGADAGRDGDDPPAAPRIRPARRHRFGRASARKFPRRARGRIWKRPLTPSRR